VLKLLGQLAVVQVCWKTGFSPETVTGTPQGGSFFPATSQHLPACLRPAWVEHGVEKSSATRTTSRAVLSRQQAEEAQRQATAILGDLGLALHPDKTACGRPPAGQAGL